MKASRFENDTENEVAFELPMDATHLFPEILGILEYFSAFSKLISCRFSCGAVEWDLFKKWKPFTENCLAANLLMMN